MAQQEDRAPLAPPAPAVGEGFLRTVKSVFRGIALLRESPLAMVGAFIVLFWVLVAIFAPVIAPFSPNEFDYTAVADPTPNDVHPLGTDRTGRDQLSRLVYGARTVLTVAPIALLCAYIVGCTLGAVGGYFGGRIDDLISRISDIILAFPVLVLYIIIMVSFGPSALNIIFAVTITSAPGIGRIVRGLILELRTHEYRMAAQIRGESPFYIILVELLPNARGPMIIDSCIRMGFIIITIGVLGFLGLGLPPPTPDWGGMVRDAARVMLTWPHIALFPSIAISSLVIGFNFLADGTREILQRD